MDQGICGLPSRLSQEAFPRGFPTGLSHVPPWCESILSVKVEAVQGKEFSLEWTETSGGSGNGGTTLEFISPFLWRAPPLRCDGNAWKSFPTMQGKDPSSRARRRKRGSFGFWRDSRASSRVETGMSGNFLSFSKGVKDPLEFQRLGVISLRTPQRKWASSRLEGRTSWIYSSWGRCSPLTTGSSGTLSGGLMKGQFPCELHGGLLGFLSRRCRGLRFCLESVPEPEDS